MSNEINSFRQPYRDGFSPPVLVEKCDIQLAADNLVCVECGKPLGADEWCVVSTPKRKGIAVFACREHFPKAMNLLSSFIEGLNPVPENLKFPDARSN